MFDIKIPDRYWNEAVKTIAQIVQHSKQGLCIRPVPNEIPLKFCSREAVPGSDCCTRHQNDCPTK